MEYFDDFQTIDFLAGSLGGEVTRRESVEGLVDGAKVQDAQTVTPVGTPLTEIPPTLSTAAQRLYSVSTAFPPALILNGHRADVILVSNDLVLFHVHSTQLLAASQNRFNSLLDPSTYTHTKLEDGAHLIVIIPEDSVLANVLLHVIYDIPCTQYNPPLETLLTTIGTLKTYGIPLHGYVAPGMSLYSHILTETPRCPMDVYLVAAENELEALAVASSAHLLSLHVSIITDEFATRMGPQYLRRLVMLHLNRVAELKRLLSVVPKEHPETLNCGFVEQKKFSKVWGSVASSLLWDIWPDLSVGVIRSRLGYLGQLITCEECKSSLNTMLRQIILDWTTTRNTI